MMCFGCKIRKAWEDTERWREFDDKFSNVSCKKIYRKPVLYDEMVKKYWKCLRSCGLGREGDAGELGLTVAEENYKLVAFWCSLDRAENIHGDTSEWATGGA